MADYLIKDINYKDPSFKENIFDNFYEEYYDKIYNYIYFKTGDTDNAEDLTCRIIEKILNNIYRFNASESNLNTWIFTIARNHLIDYYRLKSRNESHFEANEELQIMDRITAAPDTAIIEAERQELIRDLLMRLPETEREIITLKFWGGLKNIEIASQIGINSSNINVMVFRILKKLKKTIDENNIIL